MVVLGLWSSLKKYYYGHISSVQQSVSLICFNRFEQLSVKHIESFSHPTSNSPLVTSNTGNE